MGLSTADKKLLLRDAIAAWPMKVKAAGSTRDDGVAYRPHAGRNSVLAALPDPNALDKEMLTILNDPSFEQTASQGWDRVIKQGNFHLTWEWIAIDPTAPWASLFTNKQRATVLRTFARTLDRLA